ncbi:MAG: 16S rRNA (guanine(966)-N(2))-methyltransferase RsmD, partial [Actinobacteria bacterium]|nr:16S rRNA (guanine(966)-N(2))-methyltransferase RsmD [Actinomycetota bacterium]
MRVVAGDLRGRRIESPTGDATRPTTDKVREAVFNALVSLGAVEGARVMDLFAGTGAMGIEALSRGAAHCVFVEQDRAALAVLRTNLDKLGVADRSTVVAGDAASPLVSAHAADIVVVDPPYGYDNWAGVLANVGDALVIIESGAPVKVPDGWECLRER